MTLRDTISYFRTVPKKNSYLKVLPMHSLDHGDDFCTISRYFPPEGQLFWHCGEKILLVSVCLERKNRRFAIFPLLMDLNKLEYHKCLLHSMCILLINLQCICKWSVSRDYRFHCSTIDSSFISCSMKLPWCAYIRFDVGVCELRRRSVIPSHHPNL